MAGASAQAPCPVQKNEPCWFWRGVAGSVNTLRDPSAIPADRKQHEARVRRNLWGPRWARVCPGRLLSIKGKLSTVEDSETKRPEQVPTSMLLPMYEGLLVLEAVSKIEPKVPWLTDKLLGILENERGKHKRLSAYLYSTKQLPNIAVTGPQYFGTTGPAVWHRRQMQLGKGPPGEGEGEASQGWYTVQGLAEYLPPWEAFLHPKCGLYQDFYMVQWAPPHNKTDFSFMENGSGGPPGATWEPDECLPEDLDSLRMVVKRRWADQQREKEAKEREQLEREKSERALKAREDVSSDPLGKRRDSSGLEDRERQVKAARFFNPMRLELINDLASPQVRHGFHNLLRSTEDSEIKKGWPKSMHEYPAGFGPANPPGCCGETCDCMEDWHLGRKSLDAGRPWVDTPVRNTACETAVLQFAAQTEHVTRRGLVSGMHYFEANTDRHKREDVAQVAFAAGFAKMTRSILREVSHRIPLAALTSDAEGKHPGRLIQMLALGFASDEVHPEVGGPFVPLQYQAAVPGLSVDGGTGAVYVTGELPTPPGGQAIPLSFTLTSMVPGKSDRMDCGIDVHPSGMSTSTLNGLTSKVVAKVHRIEPQAVQEMIQERLRPIFNFQETSYIDVPFGVWVEAIWSASVVARTVSVGQLHARQGQVPRPNGHHLQGR
mmetsp:Transcript_9907/g.29629  ORF Transcript_9907/g.29629 Transcript_9907/m.29629 type:complete len:660 (+) Transcript_9907:46-2025(+)